MKPATTTILVLLVVAGVGVVSQSIFADASNPGSGAPSMAGDAGEWTVERDAQMAEHPDMEMIIYVEYAGAEPASFANPNESDVPDLDMGELIGALPEPDRTGEDVSGYVEASADDLVPSEAHSDGMDLLEDVQKVDLDPKKKCQSTVGWPGMSGCTWPMR